MTFHVHRLAGCAPTPLAHYLKALGILRLVAEQADPSARGWWQDETFCLLTTLDRAALEKFFLETYAPTPCVSPWNAASGFFKPNDRGLSPLGKSTAERFSSYREGIAAARGPLKALGEADARVRALKDTTKSKKGMTDAEKAAAAARKEHPEFKRELAAAERRRKELKRDTFKPFAQEWRGPHRDWMDAALVLTESGEAKFPSLLGTGGNDGRLDFTNTAMLRLGELFDLGAPDAAPRPNAIRWLHGAFWGASTNDLSNSAVGQFSPGAAGGANSTTGPSGEALVNPWDFVLMLEGAVLFSGRATKRLGTSIDARASVPFAVHAHAAGHGTSGSEKAERGEQWMPLWGTPSSFRDLSAMIGEARLQLGRQTALRPVDVAMAVSRLGVARGVKEFVRFGYLERNGQSNLAVPLGRIRVQRRDHSRLVDDIRPWMERLQRAARDKNTPARLARAERRLASSVFGALLHEGEAARWQAVLLDMVAIEEIQLGGLATRIGPIPPLSPEWLTAADDGSAAWRLANALGSAAGDHDRRSGWAADRVRHHWLPLKPGGVSFDERDKRLAQDPRVVILGRDPVLDCVALVERRLLEATAKSERRLPLVAAPGFETDPADVARLLSGHVDLGLVLGLARALMALRWDRVGSQPKTAGAGQWPDEAWIAIRLAYLAAPLDRERRIPVDSSILRRLAAGDATTGIELALRRLRAVGLRPPLVAATASAEVARSWAATLAFPISRRTARALARRFEAPTSQENR